MLITRTPLRISLAGGGSDLPSYYRTKPGAVISFAIDKYVYVMVNRLFGGGIRVSYSKMENVSSVDEIKHELVRETLRLHNIKNGLEIVSIADVPGSGTGLGSSSAFTVGLLKALGKDVHPSVLAERAYTVESEKCFHPVGKQDQYASSHGGMNFITFGKNSVKVTPLYPSSKWRRNFEKHALLLWTGMVRDANEILKQQSASFSNGSSIEVGLHLSKHAHEMYQEILEGTDILRVGELLDKTWKTKKLMAPGISNPKIDEWYETALELGASGGKLLGAGGGGFLLFIAPPDRHQYICNATGLQKVEFKFEMEGSKVIHAD